MVSTSNNHLVTFFCIIACFIAKICAVSGAKDTLGISESLKLHNGEILESSNKRYRFLSDHSSSFLVIQFVYLNHSVNISAANDYLDASSRPRISTISMNESGRLEVYGHGNSDAAVFTVNSKQKVMISKTSATLLDNGNLVLRSSSGRTVWQSFDYPSHHTRLSSGMKLEISLLSQKSTASMQAAASGPSLPLAPGSPSLLVGPPSGRKKSKSSRVVLYVVSASVAAFLTAIVLCKLRSRILRYRRQSMGSETPELDDKGDDESLFFSFTSIDIATDHFSEENKLGQGGFGPVYKVT